MAKPYTNEELINYIKDFYNLYNRIPKARDFRNNKDYPNCATYYNKFGSWNNAIELAGFTANINIRKYTKVECIEAIKDFYKKYNKVPSIKDFKGSKPSIDMVKRQFGTWNKAIEASNLIPANNTPHTKYTKLELLNYLWDYIAETGQLPKQRTFNNNAIYPHSRTYADHFGTWNKAIEEAGYEPNANDGYGQRTEALDGVLYRSWNEAEFCNKFLFEQYNYVIEPKYPKPYNKYYDWYIKELDLYIELDGGIRPETIKEKIQINKLLNRNLLVVLPNDLNKETLTDIIGV